mgnify:FL=1
MVQNPSTFFNAVFGKRSAWPLALVVATVATVAQASEDAFQNIDRDGDGEISQQELLFALEASGQSPTASEVAAELAGLDSDGSGTVSYAEFEATLAAQAAAGDPDAAQRDEFSLFDADGDGVISSPELGTVLTNQGETVTDADLTAMIGQADGDGDGVISFDEFKLMIAN